MLVKAHEILSVVGILARSGQVVRVSYDLVHSVRRESVLEAQDCIVLWTARQAPVYDSDMFARIEG